MTSSCCVKQPHRPRREQPRSSPSWTDSLVQGLHLPVRGPGSWDCSSWTSLAITSCTAEALRAVSLIVITVQVRVHASLYPRSATALPTRGRRKGKLVTVATDEVREASSAATQRAGCSSFCACGCGRRGAVYLAGAAESLPTLIYPDTIGYLQDGSAALPARFFCTGSAYWVCAPSSIRLASFRFTGTRTPWPIVVFAGAAYLVGPVAHWSAPSRAGIWSAHSWRLRGHSAC